MLDNPFTYGNPISDKNRFFGRSDEINQILSRLRNVEFESSSLVGERRIGKTSLLNYLQRLTVRYSYGLGPEKYIFIYMNLQLVGNKELTPVGLWRGLLDSMRKCCCDVEVIDVVDDTIKRLAKQKDTAPVDGLMLSNLFSKLEKKDQYVVFLLDEFEQVTSNENFDSDFFNLLRSLAIEYPLALITCSRSALCDLCHSDAIRSSPFFNIFAPISIQSFDEDEARNLISCLLSETKITFTDADMNAIFRVAGTHPYFLQMACSCLFNAYSKNSYSDKHAFMHKMFENQSKPQLADYWYHSSDGEKIVLTALALSEQGTTQEYPANLHSHRFPSNLWKLFSHGTQPRKIKGLGFTAKQMEGLYLRYGPAFRRLEERSLVISKADTYRPFSTFFSEWIYKEITDTLQDKQSYEEWLESNRTMQVRLSSEAGKGISEILPKVSSKYREMIVTWASDPKNFVIIAELLKATLGQH